MTEASSNKTGLRISFVMVGLTLISIAITYASATVITAWRSQRDVPRLAVDSLVKALRDYHRHAGSFPKELRDLEGKVWKHKQPPDFGVDGRCLSVANYYYIYHQVDPHTSSIWIVPTGPKREEGSTHFLLLSVDNIRRWKGAPLSLEEVKKLPPAPQYREMALLDMTEQQPVDLGKRK